MMMSQDGRRCGVYSVQCGGEEEGEENNVQQGRSRTAYSASHSLVSLRHPDSSPSLRLTTLRGPRLMGLLVEDENARARGEGTLTPT